VGSVTATCSARRGDCYERRQPEQTLLYQVVAEHWSSFRERAEQAGGLPEFVVDEFEAYLRCGLLERELERLDTIIARLRARRDVGRISLFAE
jgi:hypothetical protein